ncbi:hypothetical protein ACIQNI_08725 [Streptomyces sp. NPDC091266]|uniref:DUF7848 domain-containing protein n=1 Tax=Streptomyces sp. NPDC091266 TaxID=3365978 RepID=UPI003824BF74
MNRSTYRFREHRITPNCEPDAEPWTFALACAGCGESSPAGEEVDASQTWAAAHLKANPGHVDYREHVIRPYRAVPGAWL